MLRDISKQIAVGVCFFFTVFVCTVAIPTSAYASDDPVLPQKTIVTLKLGDPAPFADTLFNIPAAADILSRLNQCDKKCELEKNKAIDLLNAELELKVSLKQAEMQLLVLQQKKKD